MSSPDRTSRWFQGAILYYDEEDNRIGIEPVADNDAAHTDSKTDPGGE